MPQRNWGNADAMEKLVPALKRLNELKIQHLEDRHIEFVLG